ncbi:hypothetical protein Tco_0030035 [Tanacetum coccineum]
MTSRPWTRIPSRPRLGRDAKIVALKAKVEKAESEAVKVSELHRRVSELEVEAAARSEEVVAKLEVDYESLRGEAKMRAKFMLVQDAEAQRIA